MSSVNTGSHQGRLFDPETVTAQAFPPVSSSVEGARRYASSLGQQWSSPRPDLQNDHVRGHATYLAYRDAMNSPSGSETPGLRSSYDAMREHVNKQHEFMTRSKDEGGLGYTHEIVDDDPYEGPGAMAEDLAQGRIKTFSTKSTGGHEFFSDEENDKFRAVHDVFGHAAIGRGFSRHGEEAAYQSHAQMFPPAARAALASETRGQNSYLNYGPGGFASQEGRLVGLPNWAERTGPVPGAVGSRPRIRAGGRQLSLDL